MSSEGLFTQANKNAAHRYWYGVAGVITILTCARIVLSVQRRYQQRHGTTTHPKGWLSKAFATVTAMVREAVYPQPFFFSGKFSRFFSPMPVGKWLLLAVYWTAILILLWSDVILYPSDPMYAYKWEK